MITMTTTATATAANSNKSRYGDDDERKEKMRKEAYENISEFRKSKLVGWMIIFGAVCAVATIIRITKATK